MPSARDSALPSCPHVGSFVRFLSDYQLPTLAMHAVTLAKPPAGGKVHTCVQFAERLLKDGSTP
jgi:hypothetical protein